MSDDDTYDSTLHTMHGGLPKDDKSYSRRQPSHSLRRIDSKRKNYRGRGLISERRWGWGAVGCYLDTTLGGIDLDTALILNRKAEEQGRQFTYDSSAFHGWTRRRLKRDSNIYKRVASQAFLIQ